MPPVDERPGAVPDLERDRFERCFREHYPSVLAFSLRRIADRETAKDAAAETFAVAWRRRDRIPDPALPWLYAVALRVIANQYRSAQRRRNLGVRLEHEVGAGEAENDPADALDRRDAFSTAFARLAESEREVLRLVAWDGLDTRDAARAYGCSAGAFRVRLHRARRKLAKQLEAAGHLPSEPGQPGSEPAEEIN
jgi:RNA polymerase sigma factor (sigma-70 family)